MNYFFYIFSLALLLTSCGYEESPEIQKALAIQKEYQELGDSFKSQIEDEIASIRTSLSDSLNHSSPSETIRLNNTLEALVESQMSLEHWTKSIVELPGHHHHEEGEVCTHDHSRDAIIEELPDQEILKMQEELKAQLLNLIAKAPSNQN